MLQRFYHQQSQLREKQYDQNDQLRQQHPLYANNHPINAHNLHYRHQIDDQNTFFREIPQFTKQMNSLVQATGMNQPNDVITQPPLKPYEPATYQRTVKKHSTLPATVTNYANTRSIYDNVPTDTQAVYYNRIPDQDAYRKLDEPSNGTNGSRATDNTCDGRNKDDQGESILSGSVYTSIRKSFFLLCARNCA